MKKLTIALLLALFATTAQADFFGGNDGEWKMGPYGPYWDESDWPEWTPMYWMEEFFDSWDDDDDDYYGGGYGGYGMPPGYGYPMMPYGGGYGGGYGYPPMPYGGAYPAYPAAPYGYQAPAVPPATQATPQTAP